VLGFQGVTLKEIAPQVSNPGSLILGPRSDVEKRAGYPPRTGAGPDAPNTDGPIEMPLTGSRNARSIDVRFIVTVGSYLQRSF